VAVAFGEVAAAFGGVAVAFGEVAAAFGGAAVVFGEVAAAFGGTAGAADGAAGGFAAGGALATSDPVEGRGRNTRDGVRFSPASHTASHASPGTAGGMSQLASKTPASISRGADSTPSETSTRSGAFLFATPVGSTTNTRTATVARVDAGTAFRSSTANGRTGSGAARLTCLLPTMA
jgi:hypothetical protein